jgi:hypothetical protein
MCGQLPSTDPAVFDERQSCVKMEPMSLEPRAEDPYRNLARAQLIGTHQR